MSEDIEALVKKTVSAKRYIHSVGVAQTTQKLLKHYHCSNYTKEWNGYEAAYFCGTVHDLARELTPEQTFEYCRNNNLEVNAEQEKSAVLMHGLVAVSMIEKLVGKIPQDWEKAIVVHTTGDSGMNDLALALFAADFIEPSRTYMTDERRGKYLGKSTIEECALAVLQDIIDHWNSKGAHGVSFQSEGMLEDLKRRIG